MRPEVILVTGAVLAFLWMFVAVPLIIKWIGYEVRKLEKKSKGE